MQDIRHLVSLYSAGESLGNAVQESNGCAMMNNCLPDGTPNGEITTAVVDPSDYDNRGVTLNVTG